MKIVKKDTKAGNLIVEGVVELNNVGELCLVEFDGEGDVVREVRLADVLERAKYVGEYLKIKFEIPKDEKVDEMTLDFE